MVKLTPAVSNKGRYRSYTGKISRGTLMNTGIYCMHTGGGRFQINRLVAAAFRGPPAHPDMDAAHLNGDVSDNTLENIDWRTRTQVREAWGARQDPSTKKRPITCKAIRYRPRGEEEWTTFAAVADLAAHLGLSNGGSLSSIALKQRKHSQYECEFVEVSILENEVWKAAPDVKIYVSSLGRVQYTSSHVISFGADLGEYKAVQFANGSTVLVHDLVLRTFVGPRAEGMVIDHLDGNKHNNALSNLEYVTTQVNNQRSHDTTVNRKSSAPARSLGVVAVSSDGTETEFASYSAAARHFDVAIGRIEYAAKTGRVGTDALEGYTFRKATAEEEPIEGEEWRDITDDVKRIAKRIK